MLSNDSMESNNYINVFFLLGDYDSLVALCNERLMDSYHLHISIAHYDTFDCIILEAAYNQLISEFKPVIPYYISVMANKNVMTITGIDYIEHYNTIVDNIMECLEYQLCILYASNHIIRREYDCDYTPRLNSCNPNQTESIKLQLEYLTNVHQPSQRTAEWYDYRQTCITASSAWKILDSPAQQENFIKSKLVASSTTTFTNILSTFHHGHKYEPLSTMIYEHINQTVIGEFGCIKHQKYDFIGASPDGINISDRSPKYGVLLEVKNVVSREITGIPKKDYWVQMQMQMEVCNMDYCDFLETKFTEYEDDVAFLKDADDDAKKDGLMTSKNGNYMGLMVMFYVGGEPVYEYCPISENTVQKIIIWKDGIINKYLNNVENSSWVDNIFWKCDTYSCICVERNRAWFKSILPSFERMWLKINAIRTDDTIRTLVVDTKPKRARKERAPTGDIFDRGNIGTCLIKL